MDLTDYLNKKVEVIIDRPLGSGHPEYNYVYPINAGYVPGTKMPDGEELDVFILGVDKPHKKFTGICIAIIHRTNDDDDKLIVVAEGKSFTDEEIEKAVEFQEKWFKHVFIKS